MSNVNASNRPDKKKQVGIILTIVAMFVLWSHMEPAFNWYRMNEKIKLIEEDPVYTIGTKERTIYSGRTMQTHFKYMVGSKMVSSHLNLSSGNMLSSPRFYKLNDHKYFLVVYNKHSPKESIIVPTCPLQDSSSIEDFKGEKLEWRFYEGLVLKD